MPSSKVHNSLAEYKDIKVDEMTQNEFKKLILK
jgi:hypothetical protein